MKLLMTTLTIFLTIWFIKQTVSFLLHCTFMGRMTLKTCKSIIGVSKYMISQAKKDYVSIKKHYEPKKLIPVAVAIEPECITFKYPNTNKSEPAKSK